MRNLSGRDIGLFIMKSKNLIHTPILRRSHACFGFEKFIKTLGIFETQIISKFTHAGDLLLFDLGYWRTQQFASIQEKGAYFLAKLKARSALYTTSLLDCEKIDLSEMLESIHSLEECIVYLGKTRVKVRLIL